jgi:putative membrane protein
MSRSSGARPRRSAVKISVRIALALGLGVVIALIAIEGAGTIADLLSRAGWILLLLVPLQLLPLYLDVLGWRMLILTRVRVPMLFLIATVRQAVNRLLPVANVGGEIIGIRLLRQQGLDGTAATASVIIELLLALVAQYFFVALGVMCLFARTDNARVMHALIVGLAACLPPLVLMVVVLRHGQVFLRIEHMAKRLFSRWLDGQGLDHGARLDAKIRETFAARTRIFQALGWQFAGFVVGSSETWLALRWLGHPVSVADALVLESLTQAAKSVFFMVPAALGVQEAGLVGAGLLLGLGSDVALALSLAKRMREVLFGLPALAAWQWMEVRKPDIT